MGLFESTTAPKVIFPLAVDNNEIHFEVDIEPPGYSDRPHHWHDQLNSAFESAR